MLKKVCKVISVSAANRYGFSVHNYMKTFKREEVTRYHGHFRVD